MEHRARRARQDGRQHARADPPRRATPYRATTATPRSRDVDSLEAMVEALPTPEGGLGDGAGGRPDPRDRQGARRAARRGRHRHRRRQLALDRRPRARRAAAAEKGIGFIDCGVSGGVWGLENGYALMAGGYEEDIAKVQPIFDALRPEGDFGWVHAGGVGAGHFSKMVHNGIEYAVMQAYAEGWELLQAVEWSTTSPRSSGRGGRARSSGRGCSTCWSGARRGRRTSRGSAATPRTPVRAGGPSRPRSSTPCRLPAIAASLFARFASRQDDSPAMKAVAAMRNQFGGHAVHADEPPPGEDEVREAGGRPPPPSR